MAVSTPIAAGNPLALAIPKLRGKASKKTKKPDRASAPRFCLRPSRPSLGISIVFMFIDCVNLTVLSLLRFVLLDLFCRREAGEVLVCIYFDVDSVLLKL